MPVLPEYPAHLPAAPHTLAGVSLQPADHGPAAIALVLARDGREHSRLELDPREARALVRDLQAALARAESPALVPAGSPPSGY